MASRLSLDEVLSRVFDDDFGLEEESSEEEGEEQSSSIHAFSGLHTIDPKEVAALDSIVTSYENFFSRSERLR